MKIISEVKDGKLKRNRKLITDTIKSFEGKTIEITIEKNKKKRSNEQNAFYWGVVIPMVEQAYYDANGERVDKNYIHYSILIKNCAPFKTMVNEETGEVLELPYTSSELTTTMFCEYLISIQKFCAEWFNIVVPDPNENISLQL